MSSINILNEKQANPILALRSLGEGGRVWLLRILDKSYLPKELRTVPVKLYFVEYIASDIRLYR